MLKSPVLTISLKSLISKSLHCFQSISRPDNLENTSFPSKFKAGKPNLKDSSKDNTKRLPKLFLIPILRSEMFLSQTCMFFSCKCPLRKHCYKSAL